MIEPLAPEAGGVLEIVNVEVFEAIKSLEVIEAEAEVKVDEVLKSLKYTMH